MKKIAVIGSINMDMTVEADKIPSPGETLIGRNLSYSPGGKGANQAVAAAKLGGYVTMFGAVGDDDIGDRLLGNFEKCGVHTQEIVRIPGISSGLAVIAAAHGENSILVVPGANNCVSCVCMEEKKDRILESDIVILQNEIPLDTVHYVIDFCAEAGKFIIYNPAPAALITDEIIEKVSCLTPNEIEAGRIFDKKDLGATVRAYRGKVIVTLGGEGVLTSSSDGDIVHIPAVPVQVKDTTGAGDEFNGALAYALARGMSVSEAIYFANAAAAFSTQSFGAQSGMPDEEQVWKLLK